VPIEMPIAMPAQNFSEHPRDFPHRRLNIDQWARRMLVVLLALLPASMAAHEMRRSIGLDGISLWEGVYLALFIPLFAWIAFGFATSASRISSTLGVTSSVRLAIPVVLPPGLDKLAIRFAPTGSCIVVMTIGMVEVARCAARTAAIVVAMMTFGFWRTTSRASCGKRS